jgi:hypothetical protein
VHGRTNDRLLVIECPAFAHGLGIKTLQLSVVFEEMASSPVLLEKVKSRKNGREQKNDRRYEGK